MAAAALLRIVPAYPACSLEETLKNLDRVLKIYHFANKDPYNYPVVMYGCESWTIKKAEC